MNKTLLRLGALLLGVVISVSPFVAGSASAAVSLTISPITWDVVGLDSNNPATGPNRFPVGARVCSVGGTATTVSATFTWDSANTNVSLRPGSLSTVNLGSISSGACVDAYFEAEISRTAAAFDTVRRYHITATDAGSGATVTSVRPRQLYVEHLISQNRNGITSITLNGTPVPAGGSMTLVQGRTYDLQLNGYTATQGYNQLEAFTGLPNTVFQVLSATTTYSANTSPYVASPSDKLYADACGWDSDPNSPNYRSCIGGDAKTGGTVSTTYHVRVVGGAGTSETLGSLLYDFSGSSYHYNADFGVGARIADIVGPSSIPISKTFTPKVITPGGTSTLTFRVANPTADIVSGITFTDTLPAGMKVAGTPAVSYSGCGAGAFSPVPVADATSLSFANGTIAANGVCTATVAVTAPAGTYTNTTGHLFLDGTVDTGNTASATLTAASAAACTPGQTLASWTVPNGTIANPPDTAGGLPTTKGTRVVTAAALATVPADTSIVTNTGHGDTTAWRTYGYKTDGNSIQFTFDTSSYSGVSMSFWVANPSPANGPTSITVEADPGSGFVSILPAISNPVIAYTQHTADATGKTSTSGITTFQLTATGAKNNASGASLDFDDIVFTGCLTAPPAPTLAKAFAADPVVKGATTTLAFTLDNTAPGNQPLTGIAFTDVLPAGLSVATTSSSHCGGTVTTTAGSRTIALSGGTLAAGGSCSFNVTITGTTEGQYENVTGFVSTTEGGATTSYATDSLTVIAPPTIAKDFSPAAILKDGSSTLTFTIGNPNPATALTGIGFSDTLPAGVSLVTGGPLSECGGTLTTTGSTAVALSGASLAAGATCSFAVAVTGTTAGTRINTTGVITSTEGGPGTTASATLEVANPTAALNLTKQVSTDGSTWRKFTGVSVGGSVYYRFVLYNAGDLAITSTDVVDPDVTGCTWTGPANPTLNPGDTAYCTAGPIIAVAGLHTNTAHATGTSILGAASSAASSASYGTFALGIDKTATESSFVAAGDVLHYSFLVTNSGAAPLLGPVTVADDKAADEACPAVATVGDADQYLDPGESVTCTATYTVTAGDVTTGHVTNLASATADGVTSATDTVTVGRAALTLDKTSTETTFTAAGDVLHYHYLVTNSGGAPLAGPVTVADDKATDETCPAVTTVGNLDASFDPGESLTCSATYTVTAGDVTAKQVTNTATASAGGVTSPSDQATVSLARLSIAKASTTTAIDHAGQVVPYSITVTNGGGSTLTNLTVTDPLCSSAPVYASGDTGTDGVFATGEAWVYTCSHTATQAAMNAGGNLANTATAETDQTAPRDGTLDIPVAQSPAVTITKDADPGSLSAPGAITYTITVANTGNIDLTGVSVTDPLTGGAAYTSGDNANTGVLDVGETWVYTATYDVTQAIFDAGAPIVNTASVTTSRTGPDSDDATTDLATGPALSIEKASTTTTIDHVGQVVPYTITVANTGNVTLTGLAVTDPLCDAAPVLTSGDTGGDTVFSTGEAWVFTCSHTATQAELDAGGTLTNTATADTDQTTPQDGTYGIPVTQAPALTLDKTVTEPYFAAAADTLHYSYLVTNSGSTTLDGPVTVADDTVTVDCPATASLAPGGTVTCTASYTVTAGDVTAGHVTNIASATAGTTTSGTDTVTVPIAALTIDKVADPVSISSPGSIDYTITVANTGGVALTGIVVTDVLTGGATYVSGDTTTTGVLDMGETWVYSASLTVTQADIDAGDPITNTASVDSDQAGPASANATTTIAQTPWLAVSKASTTDEIAAAGQLVPYTITVDNTGNITLTSITVADPACDAAPAYVSGDTGSDSRLGVGETWTYSCGRTVTQDEMDAGGDLSNTVSADSAQTGPDTDSLDIPISQHPALTIVKSITGSHTFTAVGDVISYAYLVTNSGNVTIGGPIAVEDDRTTVTCPDTEALASGAAVTCSATYAITQADLDAASVTNTARASGLFGEAVVASTVVAASVTRIVAPTTPPSATLDAPAATAVSGWAPIVFLLFLGIGLIALAVASRPGRRRRSGR